MRPPRRTTAALALALPLLSLTACSSGGAPDEPTVTGTVSRADSTITPSLIDASDAYYEGLPLPADDVDLVDGAAVEVWIGSGCAESYPVQCDIDQVRVAD
jgi:hypothetical protein